MKLLTATSLAALATLFVAAPAHSADLSGRLYTPDDNPAGYARIPAIVWTGIYVGGQVGVGNSNHNVSVEGQEFERQSDASCTDASGNPVKVPENATEAPDACDDDSFTFTPATFGFETIGSAFVDGLNSSGVFGGGTIGADFQRGNIVFGAFADYNLGSGSTDVGVEFNDPAFALNSSVIEDGDSWLIAGRVGVLFGEEKRALLYALGGYGQQEFTYTMPGVGSKDVTHSGWVVGAGGEYALTQNVFVGIEWQHFFGDEETIATFDNIDGDPNVGDGRAILRDEVDSDKVMAKLKIKLNQGILGN